MPDPDATVANGDADESSVRDTDTDDSARANEPASTYEDPPPPAPIAPRLVLFVAAVATPTVAWRLGGVGLWVVMAAGMAIAAAIAMYLLWADGMLPGVVRPQGLDLTWGVAVAVLLVGSIMFGFNALIAPQNEIGGLLRHCTLEGVRVPRGGGGGLHAFFEWVRQQTCHGYARTLHIPLAWRAAATVGIALMEELAWRGGVQQVLSEYLGSTRGWIAAAVLYALAHAVTGVIVLVPLALVAGLAWGALFRYRGRLVPSLASHAAFSYALFHAMPLVAFR